MKKLTALILILAVLFTLVSCGSTLKDPVSFYYLRTGDTLAYGYEDGLIATEEREAAGHVGDLEYLISLYLNGPLGDHLVSPFPSGVRLELLTRRQDSLTIVLSESFSHLSGMELSIACACLCRTAFGLTDANTITILSPKTNFSDGIKLIFARDSFLLIDQSLPEVPSGTEPQ